MKKIYIAHPYAESPNTCKKSATVIAKIVMEEMNGEVLPISPLHLFSWLDEEGEAREHILSACLELMKTCEAILVFDSLCGAKAKDSEGVALEVKTAAELGIDVEYVDFSSFCLLSGGDR